MIVTRQKDKIVMVKHAEHCIHAGEIVSHWGNNRFVKPTPNESLVLAIQNHDIGWKEVDDKVLYDEKKKAPLNFLDIDLPYHLDFYEASYKYIMDRDPYAGLLMGMHWVGLYTARYGYQPEFVFDQYDEVEQAIKDMEKSWIDLKYKLWNQSAQSRRDFEDELWMHYEIFQVMDRFSLFICMNDHDLQIEQSIGKVRPNIHAEPVEITLRTSGDGKLHVTPFPFDSEFEAEVPVRRIPDKPYESHEALVEEIEKTKPDMIRVRICP